MTQIKLKTKEVDMQRLRLLKQLGLDARCIFDVGASDGCWSYAASEIFPDAQYHLFEPLSDHAADYQQVTEVLRRRQQFHLHKAAVGPECRQIPITVYPNPVGSTALPMDHCPENCRRVEVKMLTIDHATRELKLPPPQVIKADTQGGELGVLQGARQTLEQVDVLFLECWLRRSYGEATPLLLEIANWLSDYQFHLWDLGESWRNKEGVMIAQDCIFLNARSRISSFYKPPIVPQEAPAQSRRQKKSLGAKLRRSVRKRISWLFPGEPGAK